MSCDDRNGQGRNKVYTQGVRSFRAGDYAKACERFQTVIESEPDYCVVEAARAHLSACYAALGKAELLVGRFAEAAKWLGESVQLHPEYADNRMLLADAYRGLGDRTSEAEQVQAALAINPSFLTALLRSAVIAYEGGDPKHGLSALKEIVAGSPNLDGVAYRAGLERHLLGDVQGAVERFLAIAPKDLRDANIVARQADEFADVGQWEEAAELYRRALQIAPRFADVHCRYGRALLEMDKPGDAIAAFREAIAIHPRYANAHAWLGAALRRSGDEDGAIDSFMQALICDPSDPVAIDGLHSRAA